MHMKFSCMCGFYYFVRNHRQNRMWFLLFFLLFFPEKRQRIIITAPFPMLCGKSDESRAQAGDTLAREIHAATLSHT